MTTADTPIGTIGDLGERTLREVRRRIMPLIVLLHFIAHLGRNDVGFAELTTSEDILDDAPGSDRSGLLFLTGGLTVTAIATYAYARNRPEGKLS